MKMKYLLGAVTLLFISSTINAQVSIIVNKSVPAISITKAELLDIYSLSTIKWGNGEKAVLFDLRSDDNIKNKFYEYMGKSNSNLKKVWMRAQLTGEGFAPEALNSSTEVVNKVALTPGAIGFVDSKAVTGDVKVILKIE